MVHVASLELSLDAPCNITFHLWVLGKLFTSLNFGFVICERVLFCEWSCLESEEGRVGNCQ